MLSQYCFATVTTDSYFVGTLTVFSSFLHYNKWFTGDFVFIHNELSEEHKQMISALSDRVRFLQIGFDIMDKLTVLSKSVKRLQNIIRRFDSLEIFSLQNYKKVLFCDSDMIFINSIEELFNIDAPLVCCGVPQTNGCAFLDVSPFQKNQSTKLPNTPCQLIDTFNAGMMLFDQTELKNENRSLALNLLESSIWMELNDPRTDQLVFNYMFAQKHRKVSYVYNFLLPFHSYIKRKEGIGLQEAKAVHFLGKWKPWRYSIDLMKDFVDAPFFIQAIKKWQSEYINALSQLHLRQKMTS